MNCEQFDELLADALGDELSAANRPAFEEHVGACKRCRREYESASAALTAMRALLAPPLATVGTASDDPIRFRSVSGRGTGLALRWFPVLRYAAAVLIAFTAGYFYRAEQPPMATSGVNPIMLTKAGDEPGASAVSGIGVGNAHAPPRSFEAALAVVHLRNPSQSDLAKCMIAMFQDRR